MARRHRPVALKIISGSRRIPDSPEPIAEGELEAPPAWLTLRQRESWAYAIQHAPAGLLRKIDRSVLTAFVISATCMEEASEKVERSGLLIKGSDGMPVPSPYLQVRNKQMLLMLRCIAELGFSPASRAGVAAARDATNPFSRNGRRPPLPA